MSKLSRQQSQDNGHSREYDGRSEASNKMAALVSIKIEAWLIDRKTIHGDSEDKSEVSSDGAELPPPPFPSQGRSNKRH